MSKCFQENNMHLILNVTSGSWKCFSINTIFNTILCSGCFCLPALSSSPFCLGYSPFIFAPAFSLELCTAAVSLLTLPSRKLQKREGGLNQEISFLGAAVQTLRTSWRRTSPDLKAFYKTTWFFSWLAVPTWCLTLKKQHQRWVVK